MAGIHLFLLRHAVAEERDVRRWPDDAIRPLTAEGAARMRTAAQGMRAMGLHFDLILTSPLERAMQTAAIVSQALRPSPEPAIVPALAPAGDIAGILGAIPAVREDGGSVLLVGHEPDLTRLASALLLGKGQRLPIEFRKGGLMRIDVDGPPRVETGRLVYHLRPRILRLLAKAGSSKG